MTMPQSGIEDDVVDKRKSTGCQLVPHQHKADMNSLPKEVLTA